MTAPRRALAAGLAVTVVYVASAILSGRLSPLARRPLLDGFAPPPPYRWVKPPPSLAASNEKPSAGSFTIDLDPTDGSAAGVFSTDDNQASIALGGGAIPPLQGDRSVLLQINPLAPAARASIPGGRHLVGNVYRMTASYRPSRSPVGTLQQPGQVVLAYPSSPDLLLHGHTLLSSTDGKSWRAAPSTDSIAQQLVQASVSRLGYFAVGESTSGTRRHTPTGTILYRVFIFGGIAIVAVAILIAELRIRRKNRRTKRRPPRRRPPPARKRIDPWRD